MSGDDGALFFNFSLDKQRMIQVSNGKEWFCCTVCTCSYKHEFSLRRHYLRSHVNRSCLTTSDMKTFGLHSRPLHAASSGMGSAASSATIHKYTCNVCASLYQTEDELIDHVKSKHQVFESREAATLIIRCSECQAEFTHRRNLMCHMRVHKPVWKERPSQVPQEKQFVTESDQSGMSEDALQRQLRARNQRTKKHSFVCTTCRKHFDTYGNLLRHQRLTHEQTTRRRVPFRSKSRRHAGRSFNQPDIACAYYNSVGQAVAFNIKNCIHGNAEHLKETTDFIQGNSKSKGASYVKDTGGKKTAEAHSLSRKTRAQYNIKLFTFTERRTTAPVHKEAPPATPCPIAQDTAYEKFKEECSSLDIYDKPGLWKFLCLVCLQYFPNTLELFAHQDTQHKGIKTTYMEVGKRHILPLMLSSSSITDGVIVAPPTRYICTKCHTKLISTADLHNHMIACGSDLLKPISVGTLSNPPIPIATDPQKPNRKRHWRREANSHALQPVITDMAGSNSKKKKLSRLEVEVKAQLAVEAKINAVENLSPRQRVDNPSISSPSTGALASSRRALSKGSPLVDLERKSGQFTCQYCGLTFKYHKVFHRHVNESCEMRKIVTSPKSKPDVSTAMNGFLERTSPQRSKAQARVLARFIHPARRCGPCFACKKPNSARRYTHLQQRSQAFVEFVMTRNPHISAHSCLCKMCELQFRKQYESQKSRRRMKQRVKPVKKRKKINRHKAVFMKRNVVAERQERSEQKDNVQSCPSPPAGTTPVKRDVMTQDKMEQRVKIDGEECTTLQASPGNSNQLKTSLRRKTQCHKRKDAFLKHHESQMKISTAQQLIQCKSSLDTPIASHSNPSENNYSLSVLSEPPCTSPSPVMSDKPTASTDIMVGGDSTLYNKRSSSSPRKESSHTSVTPASGDWRKPIDLPSKGTSQLDSSLASAEESDAKFKVVLQFVKSSPPSDHVNGKKSSLTEIIDAVTRRVREEPRLGKTLMDAINAVTVNTPSSRKQACTNGYIARKSKSLPAVLNTHGDSFGRQGNLKNATALNAQQRNHRVIRSPYKKSGLVTDGMAIDSSKQLRESLTRKPVKRRSEETAKDIQVYLPSVKTVKRRFIMPAISYEHMCDVINSVASGDVFVDPTSRVRSLSSDCDSLLEQSRSSSFDCDTLESPSEQHSIQSEDTTSNYSLLDTNPLGVPEVKRSKNKRLATIISKLAQNTDLDAVVGSRPSSEPISTLNSSEPSNTPDSVQCPSISSDSGFNEEKSSAP